MVFTVLCDHDDGVAQDLLYNYSVLYGIRLSRLLPGLCRTYIKHKNVFLLPLIKKIRSRNTEIRSTQHLIAKRAYVILFILQVCYVKVCM